jgi:hypothetical protein
MSTRIDLDCLLHGEPSWIDVTKFFKQGDFHEEHYEVAAIEKHLLTETQRKTMFDNKLSIEKMLNGRFPYDQMDIVESIFAEWNRKLGFKHYGF